MLRRRYTIGERTIRCELWLIFFLTGDQRVNQYTGLTVLHIVWIRLHNKYANQLALINPKWDDERLYQETKKIVAALVQHITYNEYLPSVLGRYRIF